MVDTDPRPSTAMGENTSHRSMFPSPHGSLDQEKGSSFEGTTDTEEASVKRGPSTAETTQEDESEYPHGALLYFIILALLLSIFLVSLDMTIVATAIPKITDEFHGIDLVGWYGAAFFLTLGAFQSTWGKAYKYFPLKPGFLISIFVFELGSLICGVAPNSTTLIVGRAIAGVGGAGISSGAYTIIAFSAPPQLRPAFTGLMGASYGVASVVGPLLGGVFAEKVSWRWCFYINLPIGGVSAAIILIFFKTPPQSKPVAASFKEKILQMDLPGAFTLMAAIVCYILAMQWGGQTKSWNDSTVIGTLVGFGLLLVLFGIIEYFQGDRAMLVGRLLKDRTICISTGFMFFLGGSFFLLLYYLPIYFQVVSGATASESGIRNLPLIIGVVIATITSGGMITATGHLVPWLIGGSILTTIGSGLLYTLSVNSSSAHWIGYQVIAGIGIGASFQVSIISGQAMAAPSDLASVTAMILFFQTIGGAFFVSAGETAFSNVLLKRLPITAPSVDPTTVTNVGISQIRSTFTPDVVPGVVQAYMDGLKTDYAIAIAASGVAVLISALSKWTNLKGKLAAAAAAA